jgi:thiol-disulfide isomerase/thioredoxin
MEIVPATPASEFQGIDNWINTYSEGTHPTIKGLKGKIILLDCWTYTCIFCLRTIPIMKRLQQKYGQFGLEVIMAHSAEYEFAQDITNLRSAIQRYSVTNIPVGFDKYNKTWEAYGNTYWPKHILIDYNGFIRYEHAGYGCISEFEESIRELLEEIGQAGKLPEEREYNTPPDEIYDTYGIHFDGIAPEICVGYSRLRRFGNVQTIKPEEKISIPKSATKLIVENSVYLYGNWVWRRECVQSFKGSEKEGGQSEYSSILIKYNRASRVHAIMGTLDRQTKSVEVKIDGSYLTRSQLGKDAFLTDDGKCVSEVGWPHIYNLVKTDSPEVHEVEIICHGADFLFFTFVFG